MAKPPRPFTTSDLPYAPLHLDDGVVWMNCPRCLVRIDIVEHKDINSFSFVEYQTHYLERHGEADGFTQIDGSWFKSPPAPEPPPLGKAW